MKPTDEEVLEAISRVAAYWQERTANRVILVTLASRGRKAFGGNLAARYCDCRAAGMDHEAAIGRLKAAIDWGMREWWHKPDMRPYVRPSTLFRPTRFDERY